MDILSNIATTQPTQPARQRNARKRAQTVAPVAQVAPAQVAPVKRGRGQPTLYRPEYCEQVIELGNRGFSEAMIAKELGVCVATLSNWERSHPEFLAATARAKELALSWFERVGLENVGNRDFNTRLWEVQVRCRFPAHYRDITRTELTGNNGGAIKIEDTSDDELMRIAGLSKRN